MTSDNPETPLWIIIMLAVCMLGSCGGWLHWEIKIHNAKLGHELWLIESGAVGPHSGRDDE